MGFTVTLDVGNDVIPHQRKPDLFVERDGHAFYVEATACVGDDVLSRAQQSWTKKLHDLINSANLPDFLVSLYVGRYGRKDLGKPDVAEPLERWLNALDADEWTSQVSGRSSPPS